MPSSPTLSPRRQRARRYYSTSSIAGQRWRASSGSPSNALARRRGSSTSASHFTFSPNHTSETEAEDGDDNDDGHDSGLEDDRDDASVVSNPETFATLHARTTAHPPLTYSSLPPTPISTSPLRPESLSPKVLQHQPLPELAKQEDNSPPFSLWDYLREELLATDFDSHQEMKWERVSNFLTMPVAVEKVRLLPFTDRTNA